MTEIYGGLWVESDAHTEHSDWWKISYCGGVRLGIPDALLLTMEELHRSGPRGRWVPRALNGQTLALLASPAGGSRVQVGAELFGRSNRLTFRGERGGATPGHAAGLRRRCGLCLVVGAARRRARVHDSGPCARSQVAKESIVCTR